MVAVHGLYVEVDEDRCNLIDVLNDFVDEAKKNRIVLPTYPSLSYIKNMKHVYLESDIALMKMFEVKKDKEIIIWVGERNTSTECWKSALRLRNDNHLGSVRIAAVTEPEPEFVTSKQGARVKLPIRRAENLNSSSGCVSQPSKSVISPRRSPRKHVVNPQSIIDSSFSPHVSSSNSTSPPSKAPHITPIIRKNPRFKSKTKLDVPGHHNKKSLEWYNGKRIPKASARLMAKSGLTVGMTTTKSNEPKGAGRNFRPRTRPRSTTCGAHVHGVEESESEDYEYEPELMVEEDDSESDHDLDEEPVDVLEDEAFPFVEDGYEPNEGDEWLVDAGDDDDYFDKLFRNGELYCDEPYGSIKLKSWMLFTVKKHFKLVFTEYCIQEGFSVVVSKADKKRYTAQCATAGCPFRIHASLLVDGHTFAIKSLTLEHDCIKMKNFNPMASYKWVAHKLLEKIRANNDEPLSALNDTLFEVYGIKLKKSTGYSMRAYALSLIHGGHDISYGYLPAYCEEVKETNPSSIAHCAWVSGVAPESPLVFKSIFVSFAAQHKGFLQGCRGLIGVDGAHLKGNYRGVLLSAVALDGNNEIFPIAHGIHESESKETWSSFIWHLKQLVSECARTDWTIISDRQKGILPALDDVWPTVTRRFCARHLCKNFKKEYPGPLMHALFWRIAGAYSKFGFKKGIDSLAKHAGDGAVKWLADIGGYEFWARFKIEPGICQDEVTTSFVESFNAILGSDRSKPVLTLLEGIRRTSMVRMGKRQQIADSWPDDRICPKVAAQLVKITKDARFCKVYDAGRGQLEVKEGQSYLPVSLENRTCACGRWQISGIPCKHAMRAIVEDEGNPANYCDDWYSVKRYKEAYGFNISPMGDKDTWKEYNVPTLEPPPMKRSIGRPSKNRRREEGEKQKGKRSTTVQCSKCKAYGHNSRTCKGGLTAKEAKACAGGLMVQKNKKEKRQISSSQPDPILGSDTIQSQELVFASQATTGCTKLSKKRKTNE